MPDRALCAATVHGLLAAKWPGRFRDHQLRDGASLGAHGLELDSIEIVELLLDFDDALGAEHDHEALLDGEPVTIGRLIDHLAAA